MSSYPDSVSYLYSLGNEVKSLKFGLEAISVLLGRLGNPQRRFRSLHVAGTNGKGSTCAFLESGLRASGLQTGLFTSPHLQEPTERVKIAGTAVSREQFVAAFDVVHRASLELIGCGELDHHPTYFETVTAMAFWLFAEARVEMAVLETGMGGRLDATNVVSPELCVITPIALDHQQWLGNTLEEIAAEKAGILKAGVPVVLGRQSDAAGKVLRGRASELGCAVREMPSAQNVTVEAYGSSFELDGNSYQCSLPGRHQVDNAVTAVTALTLLSIDAVAVQLGVREAVWPGRLELVAREPDTLLDGAHNPAGAAALASYLREFHAHRRIVMVFGAMSDKAVPEIADLLFPVASTLILTRPHSPRAIEIPQLEHLASSQEHKSTATVAEAVQLARQLAASDDVVVITGSLYLVGEARALLVQ